MGSIFSFLALYHESAGLDGWRETCLDEDVTLISQHIQNKRLVIKMTVQNPPAASVNRKEQIHKILIKTRVFFFHTILLTTRCQLDIHNNKEKKRVSALLAGPKKKACNPNTSGWKQHRIWINTCISSSNNKSSSNNNIVMSSFFMALYFLCNRHISVSK